MLTVGMTGACRCGAVRYRATGAPEFQGLCHCRDCQRLSGSGHVGFICFPSDAVAIEGEMLVRRGIGGSGRAARHYCPACLSQLFGYSEIMPGKTNIYAGSLDDPAQFTPQFAIFVRDRPPWDLSSSGLQCFETLPPFPADLGSLLISG
jgi:hypothetical protein